MQLIDISPEKLAAKQAHKRGIERHLARRDALQTYRRREAEWYEAGEPHDHHMSAMKAARVQCLKVGVSPTEIN